MKYGATLGLLWTAIPVAVQAHPGHPALAAQHSHVLFGVDPMYALALSLVGIVGGVLVARRHRRLRSKVK